MVTLDSDMNELFFERQINSDTCRLHAINNAFGRPALDLETFDKYCDQYDLEMGSQGSRRFFMVDSNNQNSLGFILNILGMNSRYYPFGQILNQESFFKQNSECLAIIGISKRQHTWAARYIPQKHSWIKFDSLSQTPSILKPENFNKHNAFLAIFDKSK